jgi:hypothetical protein
MCIYIGKLDKTLSEFIFRLPGNTRNGFITFDSRIHFYSLQEGLSQAQMLIVSDIKGMCFTLTFIKLLQEFSMIFHDHLTSQQYMVCAYSVKESLDYKVIRLLEL